MPLVNRVARPPVIGMVYRSPSRSNTMVLPSGLTSSEIHVPRVAVNSALRDASSGRGFGGPPPGPWADTTDETVATAATAIRVERMVVMGASPNAGLNVGGAVAPGFIGSGPFAGPDLVERVARVQPAVHHHVADRVGVADVLERI